MAEQIVILGGGPAGMATAWQLSERGKKVVVIEKSHEVGGMARTMEFCGCRVDFGPHIFHVRDTEESQQLIQEIKGLLEHEPHLLQHKARLLLQDKFYHYPWQILELLTKLNPLLSLKVLLDYGSASVSHVLSGKKELKSFEDWGVRNVGRTLFDLVIGRYSKKVWGLPTSEISVRQAQRVAKINLRVLILRLLGINADPVAHFRQYIYPVGGIGQLYQRMGERVKENGGTIILNAEGRRVCTTKGKVAGIQYFIDGKIKEIESDFLVNTLPLQNFAQMFDPALSSQACEAAEGLFYRSMQLIYVVIKRTQFSPAHWTYLVDDYYRCNRFSEQKSVCPEMIPEDRTVLCFELSCNKGDSIATANKEELLKIVMSDVERARLFEPSDIIDYTSIFLENVYPVYRVGFEHQLGILFKELHQFENLASIGRHGLFLNNSMDDNTLLGKMLAKDIADGNWKNSRWHETIDDYLTQAFQGKK